MPLLPRRNILRLAAGVAAVAFVGAGLPLPPDRWRPSRSSAAELIQRTATQVLDLVMTKTGPARELGILQVLQTNFDLNYMARTSLGNHWNQTTPEQRERFLKVVASSEAHAYARRFGQYGGQRLTVDGAAPMTRGGDVSVVNSKLTQTDADPIAIQWEVRLTDKGCASSTSGSRASAWSSPGARSSIPSSRLTAARSNR